VALDNRVSLLQARLSRKEPEGVLHLPRIRQPIVPSTIRAELDHMPLDATISA
jgi:hypothetical protein